VKSDEAAALEALLEARTRQLFVALDERDRERARITCQEAATRLLGEGELAEVGGSLLRVVCEELRWPFGSLWLPDAGNRVLRCAAVWHPPEFVAPRFTAACRAARFARGAGLIGQVWESGEPAARDDLVSDPASARIRAADEDGMHGACAFAMPAAGGEIAGVVELVSADAGRPAADALAELHRIGVHAGAAIERRRARRALDDLETARRIQSSVLPRAIAVPGFDIAAAMRTAADVGGDYYDVISFPDVFWVAIGDVSGHGLDAGLIMLMAQSAIGALVRLGPERRPAEHLAAANALLHDNIRHRLGREDFVTCTLMRVCADGGIAMSGAHEDVLIRRAATGRCEVLSPPGTWLAMRPHAGIAAIDDLVAQLGAGDLLILHTDGVTEAMDAGGQLFGLDRLIAEVEAGGGAPAAHVVERVFRAVDRWHARQADDMCVVAIRAT